MKYVTLILLFVGMVLDCQSQSKRPPHGLFQKEKLEQKSHKFLYSSTGEPSGVTEHWLPTYIVANRVWGNNDTIFITRKYDGYLITKEVEYDVDAPNLVARTHEFSYPAEEYRIAKRDSITVDNGSFNFFGGFIEHDSVPFFGGVKKYYKRTSYNYGDIPSYSILEFDSTTVQLVNGRYFGYSAYFDPYFYQQPGVYTHHKNRIRKGFYTELEIVGSDTGNYHEYTWDVEQEQYVDRIRPVHLNSDSSIHVVYEELPGARSHYDKTVINSYLDPTTFQWEDWVTYSTSDSGKTWEPLNRKIISGVLNESHRDQEFKLQDGNWYLYYEVLSTYNKFTRRWQNWEFSGTGVTNYTRGFQVVESDQDKILVEQKVKLDEFGEVTDRRELFKYYNHQQPGSLPEWKLKDPVVVYPNPCTDRVNIDHATGVGQLFTTEGQLVKTLDLRRTEHHLGDLVPGLYILVTENAGRVGIVVK